MSDYEPADSPARRRRIAELRQRPRPVDPYLAAIGGVIESTLREVAAEDEADRA